MLSFAKKRELQRIIVEQNKILAGKPSFAEKRQAQKAKTEALAGLGKVSINKALSSEPAEINGVDEKSVDQSKLDQEFGLQKSGIKTRERINSQVASIVDQIQAGRDPNSLTADEMALFKQYSGKGGLTENSQYEYYTPTHVAEGVWDMLKANGLGSGNILEPSTGAGVFSATKSQGIVITGTEIDPIAATVNKVLHPDDHIFNQSFEKLAVATPDNFFDGVIGNVPFGDVRGAAANDDPQYKKEKFIERYFINRVIDKTRPGGLIALVVPTRVIGGTQSQWKKFRAEISRKAEFLGGHKLPSKTFGKQGTDVVTDILVLRKHSEDLLGKIDGYTVETLQSANVLWDEFISGKYWQGEGRKYIKGQYVPPNKDDFRPMEKVIADEGMTDQALKQSLAVHFDSRIDWAILDSVEPVINYYSEGDRRIIAGKEYEFDGSSWSEVRYDANSPSISKDKFGANTIDDLAEMLKTPESALSLTFSQALAAFENYPNLVSGQIKDALLFAKSQPLDSYREQAWRGSIIGSVVTKYIAKANFGDSDDLDRQRIKNLLETEVSTYGHPKSIKGFRLDGEQARYFGSFLQSIDESGKVSSVIENGVEDAAGYNAEDALSIIEYFMREGLDNVTLEDFKRLYAGSRKIDGLGDIADIHGLVISPDGFITTVKSYCSGLVYEKANDIQNILDGETDPRLRDHYQRVIDTMMSKAKRTNIEDISFGLRDKWYDAKYKLEFLEKSGYRFEYSTMREVEKESDTGEIYIGVERTHDTSAVGGVWHVDSGQRKRMIFARQLEYYMNGQSIGYRMSKEDESDKEKLTKLREQVNGLEEQFKYFMQSHPDFQEIERLYNLAFNHYVKPDYDDSDLGLKGMSGKIKLHWYQNQGVRQLSEQGTGVLGFDVGLGKSFSALALSAYDRQMGRSKKHCIVVPNSVLANWYMESKTLYGHHDDVMFVGFEPMFNKDGSIEQEAILDENGQPKVNSFTGQIEYQDKLRKETPDEVFAKMHSIPHSSKSVVIMTQEKFKDIPLREETRMGYAEKWVDKSMMSKAQAKAMMKSSGDTDGKETSYNDAKNNDRIRGQFSDQGGVKKDQYPYFEDMGFDRVIVDEAHQFRNSYSIQDGDTAKLAYLPNAAVSQRATDMAMKCAYLRDRYDNKGPIMLTATPVANSPIEIFNMLSLVIDQSEFERIGIYTPDDFVRQFGIIQDVDKLTVRGTVEKREGLAGFKNLNALRGLFHRYSLMRGPKDVDPDGSVMKLPSAVEMIDQLDMTAEQHQLYQSLREEAKAAGNPKNVKSGAARPMFAILRDMDRVTTDVDMYHGTSSFVFKVEDRSKLDALIADLPAEVSQSFEEDEETGELKKLPANSKKKGDNIVTKKVAKVTDYKQQGDTLLYVVPDVYGDFIDIALPKHGIDYVSHPLRPKYAKLMENMRHELSNKGKQLVFTEEKSQHTKMLRLISNHLPVTADQVAVINADTAGGEKLQQISDAFNRGEVRIIIANKKAEVGVNLQKGTSAIHHLTLPWNPASLQQRNGRGVRQGNTQSHVRVYYYQARGSFDEYRLDLLKNKGNWIAALMDRHAENDSAENAEAMGAIEQAALLSDNREEFLKTMAEMQAKKDAEAKARRDSTAKIKLNQLSIQAHFLAGIDDQRAAAKSDAEMAVIKAEQRLDRLKEQKASNDEINAAESRLASLTKKAENIDAVWDKKKSDAEQQMRQNTAFLKGMERQGQLSFNAELIDNPSKNILTKDQKIVTVGSVFRLADQKVIRITDFNFYKRTVNAESVVGYFYGKDHDIDKLLENATELELTADAIEKMKWLSASHKFSDLTQVDRDFFFTNFAEIRVDEVLYREGGIKIKWGSKYYASQNGNTPVYPDRNDKKLVSELTEAYKAMKLGSTDIYGPYFQKFMPVIFGENWEESLKATMKTAQAEDMRAKAVYFIDNEIGDMDGDTKLGIAEIAKELSFSAYSENAFSAATKSLRAWMTENDFINVDEIASVISEVASAKRAGLQEKLRQIEADEQRAKDDALKSVPGYREVPVEIKQAFKALGIDVWFNDEVVQIATKYDKVTYQPFDQFWMKDSGWRLKDKLSGAENPVKRQFGAKYLGVKYPSELPIGDAKHGKSTWRVPADADLEKLLEAIS